MYASGIRRGTETPYCEEHHTDVINKNKQFQVIPLDKDLVLYQWNEYTRYVITNIAIENNCIK